ncbi:MAG: class I SAM-dependent methyltransferase [Sedimentisphaerales bacterium]|nr:class I SAM-dependent methyltransferase [Sedimentisphaerales bacterium]
MTIQLKTFVKSKLPFLVPLWRQAKYFSLSRKSPKRVFTEIFHGKKWGDRDSLSGPGSDIVQTEAVRRNLTLLIKEMNCKSLLDVPCGDFFWMKLVEMDVEYIGGDIVDELARNNQEQYGDNSHRFITLDLLQDELPRVDLILCRDCLVHFSNRHVFRALRNIKSSGSTYLLTTTFVGRKKNEDIPTGKWRPVNLQLPPFSFPTPIKLINEEYPLENYRDKHLGLWKTDDIPDL